jgi:hypothetical protein
VAFKKIRQLCLKDPTYKTTYDASDFSSHVKAYLKQKYSEVSSGSKAEQEFLTALTAFQVVSKEFEKRPLNKFI